MLETGNEVLVGAVQRYVRGQRMYIYACMSTRYGEAKCVAFLLKLAVGSLDRGVCKQRCQQAGFLDLTKWSAACFSGSMYLWYVAFQQFFKYIFSLFGLAHRRLGKSLIALPMCCVTKQLD